MKAVQLSENEAGCLTLKTVPKQIGEKQAKDHTREAVTNAAVHINYKQHRMVLLGAEDPSFSKC